VVEQIHRGIDIGEKYTPGKEPWATVALKATAGEPDPCFV